MRRSSTITDICFIIVAGVISALVIGYPPINIFTYDVFGYYMYLPLSFKYHDISIQNFDTLNHIMDTYYPSQTFYQAIKWDNGNWVMRYPIGLSVFYAPFYFLADLIAPHTSYPADGFSKPYQLLVLYGCLFYSLLGLHVVRKLLHHRD